MITTTTEEKKEFQHLFDSLKFQAQEETTMTSVSQFEKDMGSYAEAREALEHVVRVLNTGSTGAVALWDILTALRGPDSEDNALKLRTTTNLRGKIGLMSHNHPEKDNFSWAVRSTGNFLSAVVTHGEPTHLGYWEDSDPLGVGHFRHHYNAAVNALYRLGYTEK